MTSTTVLSVPPAGEGQDALVQRFVHALEAGELVALPTETVYGLAARADRPEAIQRLLQAKGSPPGRPLTWHVGAPPDLDGVRIRRPIERLVERYWPGPLTLVVEGLESAPEACLQAGSSGLRAPAHVATQAVLEAAPFPVVMTSANDAGEDPALDVGAIQGTFKDGVVSLILDAGESALGQASTVLAVGPGRFEVLRQGIHGLDDLRRVAGRSILFVCTGNTCRSPMAEGLARHGLRQALGADNETTFGFHVRSAGVYAGPGAPASENSVAAMRDRGIDISDHASSPAIDHEVAAHDEVYCLTRSHRDALVAMLPPDQASSVQLLDPDGRDVPDPFGGPLSVYRQTADVIEAFVGARMSSWV